MKMNNFDICQQNYDNQEDPKVIDINPCTKCKAKNFGLCGVIDCDFYLTEEEKSLDTIL